MRILVVEDDPALQEDLKSLFQKRGDIAETSADGQEALFMLQTEHWDAVVLDINLPGLDGLSILKTIRQDGNTVPVMILSAKDFWSDVVSGLRQGADDYVAKPFIAEELVARIEALVRRSAGRANADIQIGDLRIDPAPKTVYFRGKEVNLTAFEFRALEYLCRHRGEVVSQETLIQNIYAQDIELSSNVIEVLIARIRKKIEPGIVETVRGHGYIVK